jgi:tropomyosin
MEIMRKDQEIQSWQHKHSLLEGQNEALEQRLSTAKAESADSTSTKTSAEGMARKIQLLEDELDTAEKNVKETMEKCVDLNPSCRFRLLTLTRLRQVDVKAEHFERQVSRVEQERDAMEKKYEV